MNEVGPLQDIYIIIVEIYTVPRTALLKCLTFA